MIGMQILQPVIALAIWTMVMWAWMYATRIPAMSKSPDMDPVNKVGGTGKDLDGVLPENVQWKAHNYNHLHEQPTVFYALMFYSHLVGGADGFNIMLAWVYVALRVLHSLVQLTANSVMIRFSLFALSSLVLIIITIRNLLALG